MNKLIDLTGQRFGRLVVLGEAARRGNARYCICQCDCGKEKVIAYSNLRFNQSKSCGCLSVEMTNARNKTHGLRNTPEYSSWQHMISRCSNNDPHHIHYKQRNIKVCVRWLGENGLKNFIDDMGPRPPKHSIDRIDNNGDYTPENCRWTTQKVQSNNIERNVMVTYEGAQLTIAQLSDRVGIHPSTLHSRIIKMGWTVDKAATTPVRPRRKHNA